MIQMNCHIIWSKQKTKKFDGLVKNMIMNKSWKLQTVPKIGAWIYRMKGNKNLSSFLQNAVIMPSKLPEKLFHIK